MNKLEQEILSACMLTHENYAVAVERGVTGEWFAIGSLPDGKKGYYFSDVFNALADFEEWNERDSMVVLSPVIEKFSCHELITDIPEWAWNIEEFDAAVDVLMGMYAKRRLTVGLSQASSGLSKGDDPFEVAGRLISQAEGLSEIADSKETSTPALVDSALEIDKLVAGGGRLGLPLPWNSFQRKTFGIPSKAVTPLAGRDGKGKSRLMTFLADFWVTSGTPILYFPFEDGGHRFISNMAASHGGYDMFTIKRDFVPVDFMPNHERNMRLVRELPIYVEDMPCTVEKMYSTIATYKRKYGIQGVVIDGLKDIVPSQGDGEVGRENHVNATLVRAAIKYDVPIITVSHLTDIEDDRWISKRNIRGSKRQSQAARMVLIYQDCVLPGIQSKYGLWDDDIVLDCQKASYGESGIVCLRPELERGRFLEITPQEVEL